MALTALAGGALSPDTALLAPAELTRRVCEDLRSLVGAQGAPVFSRHMLWPRAIPQYNLGFERHLEAMEALSEAIRASLIGGSVRDGISIPECLASGAALAKRVS